MVINNYKFNEQVETIKMLLNNILEYEKCDLNHIF